MALAGGVFRSELRTAQDFADLYVDTTPDGQTRELIIADPAQYQASTSDELQLSRSFTSLGIPSLRTSVAGLHEPDRRPPRKL